MNTSIKQALYKIGTEYTEAKLGIFSNHPLGDFVRNKSKKVFSEAIDIDSTNLIIKGSVGQGVWSDTPWIAIMDSIITNSTLSGYYIVYLFSADGQNIYLCLGQGVTAVEEEFKKDWKKILHQRAGIIRTRIPEYKENFTDTPFDLKGKSPLSKKYCEAPAFYKKYSTQLLPPENELLHDLTLMLSLYDKLIFLGGTDLIELDDNNSDVHHSMTINEKKRFRMHKRLEGRANTQKVKKLHGYDCQACGFNFVETYGKFGKEYIEAHHLLPYETLEVGKTRKLNIQDDFVVLCGNCHRMIHRMDSPSDIEGLRNLIARKR